MNLTVKKLSEEGLSPNSKRKILYNSIDGHIVNINTNKLYHSTGDIKRSNPLVCRDSEGNLLKKSPREMEPQKYQINGSTESEEIIAKSDICLDYEDDDQLYNLFKFTILCQQIKCVGDMKTASTSFDLMFEGYVGMRYEVDDKISYSVYSKNVIKTKTAPFLKKGIKLTLDKDQNEYYPIYVICHRCELKTSDIEKLFPQLMYNILNG